MRARKPDRWSILKTVKDASIPKTGKYLIIIFLFGCDGTLNNKTKNEIKNDCRLIGYATDDVKFSLIGYKCADSLEYWIPR